MTIRQRADGRWEIVDSKTGEVISPPQGFATQQEAIDYTQIGGEKVDPVKQAEKAAQAKLTSTMAGLGINMSQEQRNEARRKVSQQFEGIDPMEAPNVSATLTDEFLTSIATGAIREVAREQERDARQRFKEQFLATVLTPITQARDLARASGDLTGAAGYTLLLEEIKSAMPDIEKDYSQYYLTNKPGGGAGFDEVSVSDFLLEWWPSWSGQAVRQGAGLGLSASYETVSDAVQGLINLGARIGQMAEANVETLSSDLNRIRVGIGQSPELQSLADALKDVAPDIVKKYRGVAGTISPRDFLNEELPRALQVSLVGTQASSSIMPGDAFGTIGALRPVFFEQWRQSQIATQQAAGQKQTAATIADLRQALSSDPATRAEAEAEARNLLATNPSADLSGIVASFQEKAKQKTEAPLRQMEANRPILEGLQNLGAQVGKLSPETLLRLSSEGLTKEVVRGLIGTSDQFQQAFKTPGEQAAALDRAFLEQPGNPSISIGAQIAAAGGAPNIITGLTNPLRLRQIAENPLESLVTSTAPQNQAAVAQSFQNNQTNERVTAARELARKLMIPVADVEKGFAEAAGGRSLGINEETGGPIYDFSGADFLRPLAKYTPDESRRGQLQAIQGQLGGRFPSAVLYKDLASQLPEPPTAAELQEKELKKRRPAVRI